MYSQHIPTYARFQWLNDPQIISLLSRLLPVPRLGRTGYDPVLLFRWLLYKQLMGCAYRDLESMTGIDYSTFIKFKSRLAQKHWFNLVFTRLTRAAVKGLPGLSLITDSSFVETYSKKGEQGSAYSGYKEKNGFKLHQIIDHATRLPLLQTVTHGAYADIRGATHLVTAAPKSWKVKEFLADKAYDAGHLVDRLRWKWKHVKIGIPLRRTNQAALKSRFQETEVTRALKGKERTWDKLFLNKRTEIERYFSRKKGVFKLGKERTRGLQSFRVNCYLTSIIEILEWVAKPLWAIIHQARCSKVFCLQKQAPLVHI
jgi:hypothetical protein